MKCMKCGTTITSGQVFCDPCLEDMARHPVKPGTPIQLPTRSDKEPTKTSYKKVRKPEEMLTTLRSFVFWLLLVIVALVTALVITIMMLISATEERPPLPPESSITISETL